MPWFRRAVVLACLAVLGGCAGFYRPQEGPVGERHRPRLEAAWAQPEIGYSQLWRIYVRAADPDGDLDKVWLTFTRFGATYVGNFVYLPEGQGRAANGYIQMWARPRGGLNLGELPIHATVEVRVEDRAGNQSASIVFPFTLVSTQVQEGVQPPAGFSQQVRLTEMDMNMDIGLGDAEGGRDGGM
ncbi:MAG: hypothetical protein A3J27_12050 [Candidatus Tectomicrobia bacterium RIFCSPLOWO2_12_FULL_69_37]|nr:MAG: hypothetical protein A3J27_12050 [Candidatus Tectomicrobia bacterium RIFCSPLOWO2_12_FULL_69_37]OGL64133.1 MAG: hypothetical protein A3I72_03280 [Candidatus Tectomicrobia bacterium RIFCSPLOWO2_02_FULL_70_19]